MVLPQHGWFMMENPVKTDADWGYHHLWKLPTSSNWPANDSAVTAYIFFLRFNAILTKEFGSESFPRHSLPKAMGARDWATWLSNFFNGDVILFPVQPGNSRSVLLYIDHALTMGSHTKLKSINMYQQSIVLEQIAYVYLFFYLTKELWHKPVLDARSTFQSWVRLLLKFYGFQGSRCSFCQALFSMTSWHAVPGRTINADGPLQQV